MNAYNPAHDSDLRQRISLVKRNILTDQSKRRTLRKPSFRVTDQPFILRSQMPILTAFMCCIKRKVCIARKHDDYAKARIACAARCIVQGRRIQLHANALRKQKCFDLCGLISIILCDIRLPAEQQNRVGCCDVQLRRTVILDRIQLFIVAVAVADLNR